MSGTFRTEYRVCKTDDEDSLQNALDELSNQGYTLTSVTPFSVNGINGAGSEKFLLVMERPNQEDIQRAENEAEVGRQRVMGSEAMAMK